MLFTRTGKIATYYYTKGAAGATNCVPYSSRYGATVSAKAALRVRRPKMADSLSLETSCVDKIWEQRKSSSGSCKLGQNASKWNWSNAGKHKRHPRPAVLKRSTTTKQLTGTWDDVLKPKCSMWNPGQEFASKSTDIQTTQHWLKCVPPTSCNSSFTCNSVFP